MICTTDEKMRLFAENTSDMRKGFFWEDSLLYALCASLYTARGIRIDVAKIKSADRIIKDNAGIFSNFRGISRLALAAILSMEENPEALFSKVQDVYTLLKREFRPSSFLPMTAFIIAQNARTDQYESMISKAKYIYNQMKSNHPFLTSGEDTSFAVLFAMSPREQQSLIADTEVCYGLLKKHFFSSDAVQTLSQVLALSADNPGQKCALTVEIYNRMKNDGIRFGRGYELPILGVLALHVSEIDKTIKEIVRIEQYLKTQKGFGAFGLGKKQRIMYSAILAAQPQSVEGETVRDAAVVNSVTTMIIAQQAAMLAILAATSASAAASSAAN
ncbi:MAG: DUF4003 family protein [Saccharofermentanales bacterium]